MSSRKISSKFKFIRRNNILVIGIIMVGLVGGNFLLRNSLASPAQGDFNGDNTVNVSDLSILLSNFGKTSTSLLPGDTNGDGNVNIFDLSSLLSNYGKSVPSETKLRWAPPKLTNPITLTLGTASETVKMDTQKDYIIKMPNTPKGTTTLEGGRNVVLIGGQINSGANNNVALYIKNSTGTIHIEGLLIDNKTGGDGDGISGSSKGTIQIQNTRIVNIMGHENTYHGDAVQIWGDTATNSNLTLRIDRLTASTANQGLFLRPNTEWVTDPVTKKIIKVNRRWIHKIELSNIDLYYNNKEQDPRSIGQAGDLLWWADGTLSTDLEQCRAADIISMSNVYLGRFATSQSARTSVWPDMTHPKCPSTLSGASISWEKSGMLASNGIDKAIVTGYATVGPPPGGEFVPSDLAGVNYISPGYQ